MAVGFRLDVEEADHAKDREKRRVQQEAYRRELNSQVEDSKTRRELLARQIKELEERHEQKSATYNPWGKPGCGAPLRQPDGALVTNVKAYHRAKLQGLVAQDLSPNEIGDDEQPFGFTLATRVSGEAQDAPPLRTSRSAAQEAGRRQPNDAAAVSLSPPRSRYRFDRLPPEEQNHLDRRMRERRELEAALLRQVEEKRAEKERELAAKREEDEIERMRVVRELAEERVANRSRVRDKNLRAGEAPPVRYPNHTAVGSYAASSPTKQRQETFRERGSRRKSVAWQQQHQERMGADFGVGNLDRRGGGGDGGFSTNDGYGRGRGRGGSLAGGAGPEVQGGGEGDRKRVLMILRKLEDHGRMLDQLASDLAVVKSTRQNFQAQGVREPRVTSRNVPSGDCLPCVSLSDEAFQPYSAIPSSSSLSPLFRSFQNDEDQLDRLLQRFERQDPL
eukprot:g18888.t1